MAPQLNSSQDVLRTSASQGGIGVLREAANRLGNVDKNISHTAKLRQLRSDIEPTKQMDSLTYLKQNVMSVLAKIKRKHPQIQLLALRPAQLEEEALGRHSASFNSAEYAAIRNFNRLVNQPGPSRDYLLEMWPEMLLRSEEVSKGLSGQFSEALKKKPVKTALMIGLGVAGAYLGYKLIQSLWKSADKSKAAGKGSKKEWLSKKIILPISAILIGLLGGKAMMGRFLSTMKVEALQNLKNKAAKMKGVPKSVKDYIDSELAKRAPGAKQKREALRESVNKKKQEFKLGIENAKKTLKNKEAQDQVALHVTTKALVEIYCIDPDKFPTKMKGQITTSLILLYSQPILLSKIASVYNQCLNKKSIPLASLGLSSSDIDSKSLFFACDLILKSRKQYEKVRGVSNNHLTAKGFILFISRDSSLAISNSVNSTITRSFKSISVLSLSGVKNGMKAMLNEAPIERAIDKNKETYFESIIKKFGVDTNLNQSEKQNLTQAIIGIYSLNTLLSESDATLKIRLRQYTSSPKVIDAALKLLENIRVRSKSIIDICKSRYDVKRPNMPEFDNILNKSLAPDSLYFKDGFQLIMVGEGLKINQSTDAVGSKDMAMIYLILKILKRTNDDAYGKYLGNISEVVSGNIKGKQLSPYLKKLQPYFAILVKYIHKKLNREYRLAKNMFNSMGNPNVTVDEYRKMGWVEFGVNTGKKSVTETVGLPVGLATNLYQRAAWLFNEKTDANVIMRALIGFGGSVFYSPKGYSVIHAFGEFYYFRPGKALLKTMKAMVEDGPLSGTAMKTYVGGVSSFIVIGALAGGTKAALSGRSVGLAMLKGAAGGLAAPVNMPVAGYRAARGTYRWFRLKSQLVRSIGDGNINALKDTSRLFLQYDKKAPIEGGGGLFDWLKGMKKNTRLNVLRSLYKDVYTDARIAWYKNFIKEYNWFFGGNAYVDGETAFKPLLFKRGDVISDTMIVRAERISQFVQRLEKQLPNWKGLSRLEFIEKLKLFAKSDHFGEPLLNARELDGLIAKKGRLGSEDGFRQFLKRVLRQSKISNQIQTISEAVRGGRVVDTLSGLSINLDNLKKVKTSIIDVSSKIKLIEAELNNLTQGSKAYEIVHARKVRLENLIQSLQKLYKAIPTYPNAKLIEMRQEIYKSFDTASDIALSNFKGTRFGIMGMSRLSQMKDVAQISDLLTQKGIPIEQANRLAQKISQTNGLNEIADIFKNEGLASKFSPKLVNALKGLKFLGAGLSAGGAAISGYEMAHALVGAYSTNNADRKNILYTKSGLMALNFGVDATIAGSMLYAATGKATGTFVTAAAGTGGFAATIAMAPIVYMGKEALDSMYERTKSIDDWGKVNYKQLVHDWMTTNSLNAGDSYRLLASHETLLKEKQATREKIVAAIINIDDNKLPSAKPDADRMHYFKAMNNFQPPLFNYGDALSLLRESKIYSDVMKTRRSMKLLKNKNPNFKYEINKIDLLDPKYENPDGASVQELIMNFRVHAISKIPKDLYENFGSFSDDYLIKLYCHTFTYVSVYPSAEVKPEDKMFETYLRNYLTFERKVNINKEFKDWLLKKKKADPKKNIKDILSDSKKIGKKGMDQFKQNPNEALKEDLKNKPTQAEYAIYQVAKFFGYHGSPKEVEMAKFFDEKHAGVFGFYCSKGNWYTNDNYGKDEYAGKPLTVETVKNILKEFQGDEWRDNFETRASSVVDIHLDWAHGKHPFEGQANDIRRLLEKGLAKKIPETKNLQPPKINDQQGWRIS